MKKRTDQLKLKRVFGLVAAHDSGSDPTLILSRSKIALAPVLAHLNTGAADQAVFDRFKGIKPEEIKAARAYLCRFGADTASPLALPKGRKGLLLDECIAYVDLPAVARHFGFSSHVEAEGLSRGVMGVAGNAQRKKIDGYIADFVLNNQFGGILTRDTDFAALRQRQNHSASLINIFLLRGNVPAGALLARLDANKSLIRDALANPESNLYIL